MMVEQYLLKIPVKVGIRLLEDGSFVSQSDSILQRIITSEVLDFLEQDAELGKTTKEYPIHEDFKYGISAYVRRDLIPQELPESPVYIPETWVEVIVEGNITTWEKELHQQPYLAY